MGRKRQKVGKKKSKKFGHWDISRIKPFTILTSKRKTSINKKLQGMVTEVLAELLMSGFTFQESLKFLVVLYPKQKKHIQLVERMLARGEPVYKSFFRLGFNDKYVAQINLGEKHGDLSGALFRVAKQMKDYEKQKRNMQKNLTYPLILLFFLLGMVVCMKLFILPQMAFEKQHDNLGLRLIQEGPKWLGIFFLLGMLLALILRLIFRKVSTIQKISWQMQVPIIKHFLRYFYTSFMAYEWGKLLSQGIEMKQVLVIMTEEGNTLFMQEVGVVLQKQLELGENVALQIAKWPFFLDGFATMVKRGEAKGKLGEELMLYGTKLWEELLFKMEKGIQWLQPLMFLLIGLLIVAIYSALLLPIYQSMEGLL